MPEPAETSAPPPRWPWLDRWFEPPWRALLTWLALVMLTSWVYSHASWYARRSISVLYFFQLSQFFPQRFASQLWAIGTTSSEALAACWYEPLVLRLNAARAFSWLGVRIAGHVSVALCNWGDYQLWQAFAILASSALAVPVLHGWRSRPWMVALAGAQVAGVTFYFMRTNYFGVWWMLTTIPYVVILLYGTRRLPR